jgi:hypothetical protein
VERKQVPYSQHHHQRRPLVDTDDDQVYVYTGICLAVSWTSLHSRTDTFRMADRDAGQFGRKQGCFFDVRRQHRVAILSKETFTPSATQTGFASIKAGLTLNSTLGAVFEGTSTQAATNRCIRHHKCFISNSDRREVPTS